MQWKGQLSINKVNGSTRSSVWWYQWVFVKNYLWHIDNDLQRTSSRKGSFAFQKLVGTLKRAIYWWTKTKTLQRLFLLVMQIVIDRLLIPVFECKNMCAVECMWGTELWFYLAINSRRNTWSKQSWFLYIQDQLHSAAHNSNWNIVVKLSFNR